MNNRALASMLLAFTIAVLLSTAAVRIVKAEPQLACFPGTRHTLRGVGPPSTALLILFDGRPVGGGTSDAAGAYQLSLVIGQEAPGVYPVAVAIRATHAEIATATCIVPDPDAPTTPAGSAGAPTNSAATPSTAASISPTSSATATRSSTPSITPSISATPGTPSPSLSPSISATPGTPSPSLSPSISATPGTPSPSLTASPTATRTSTQSGGGAASTTPTRTSTASATSTNTAGGAGIEVYEIDEPPILDELDIEGRVFDSQDEGIAGVSVTVTYSVNGVDKGTWCSPAVTDEYGDWICTRSIPSDLQDKQVTITVAATINGQRVTATTIFTPVDPES